MELSLYIHIPFCKSKCDYCDFYSFKISSHSTFALFEYKDDADAQRLRKEFLDSLVCDIYEQIERFNVGNIPTVYIGGGTPSVLGSDIKILFDALKKLPAFNPVEFTIEANPESLTKEFLEVCKEGGVNRLSLGIQTFYEKSRIAVNRIGDEKIIKNALSLAKKYFSDNLSVDLITGFPFHTKEIIIDDIKRIIDYEPTHISCYSMTLEPNTKLFNNVNNGLILIPENEEADELWMTAKEEIMNAGFKHYEVSNFAKKGKECLHNIRYWRMEGWLGIGPSASGTIIDDVNKTANRYTVNKKFSTELTELNRIDLIKEVIMMGYRYCEGPDPKWEIEKYIPDTLKKWKDKNIMLYLNSFLIDAFSELDHR